MSQHAAYCHWQSWQSLGSLNYKKGQKYKYLEAVIQRCSVKKVLSEISENSQENTCARASFLVKLQAWGLRPATLLKKRLLHRCFPVNFVKFLITPFFYRTPLVAASEYQKVMYCFWFFSLFNLGMNEKNRENIYQNHIHQDQLSGIHGQCNQYPYKGHFVTCHEISFDHWCQTMLSTVQKQPGRGALQLCWNHSSAWVFSCKFAAYFQKTFS